MYRGIKKLKLVLFVLIVSLVSCCVSPTAITDPPQETPQETPQDFEYEKDLSLEERIMLSLIVVRRDRLGPVIGSGVLVQIGGAPYMMTAYHVVDHMYDAGVTFKDSACHVDVYSRAENCVDILIGEEYNNRTMLNIEMDAALIPLEGFPDMALPVERSIQNYNFRLGEELLVIGCPTGLPDVFTRGVVSGFAGGDRRRPVTDADAWFGTSGGGVFLSTGEYVGYFHSMIGSRTPNGREMAEGLNIFSPLLPGWGF